MAEDKTSSPQPQSGADKDEKKDFRQLPEDKNTDEVGQDNKGLAPMLHWDVDTKSDDD
jgi:hypothetical protein